MKQKNEFGNELKTALVLATKAAETVREGYFRGFRHWMKDDKTPVSELDMAANKIIMAGLKKAFPYDGIVSEESEIVARDRDFSTKVWYIDPIDGTKSLIKRTDQFTVMIGLADAGRPALGVVYKPLSGEAYCGVVGRGAWVRNPVGTKRVLRVNKTLEGLVAAVDSNREEFEKIGKKLKKIGAEPYVRTGGEGLRIIKIAEGIANIRVGGKPSNTWDICAPMAILSAAGGHYGYETFSYDVVMDGKRRVDDNVIYAATPQILESARMALKRF